MSKKVIVIKLGTSVLTANTEQLSKQRMVEIARQCHLLKQQGYQPVLVSSGAVAAGRGALKQKVGKSLAEKQMLAALGQGLLINAWHTLFSIFEIPIAQVLLTRADVEHRERFLTARETLTQLLQNEIVPIINENDAVATTEIKVGDNDNLSALAAILCDADKLILLTDQHGLFTCDPRTDPNAKLIEEIQSVNSKLKSLAGGSGTSLGTGGMLTKLEAADTAQRAGIEVLIAKGAEDNILLKLLSGEAQNTKFIRFNAPVGGRKKWLLSGPKTTGCITVDRGAMEAVVSQGASLLAKGVTTVRGEFNRGDLISLVDEKDEVIAKGLCNFDANELQLIKGCHSQVIESKLGYSTFSTVIHRDNLVVLKESSFTSI